MKTNKLVLAVSLAIVSSAASAASVATPYSGPADTIVLQTQVASGVQLNVSVQSGIACASTGVTAVSPTASITPTELYGVSIPIPITAVSAVADAHASVLGTGTASALVTQDALGLVVVPTSAISTIKTLL